VRCFTAEVRWLLLNLGMEDRKLAGPLFGLLNLQFILGILANLYSAVPKNDPNKVFRTFGFIIFHAINGFILVVLAVVYLIWSIRHNSVYKAQAIGGLASIALAAVFGELFVYTQQDIFSLFMALSFISALLAYARVLFTITMPRKKERVSYRNRPSRA
jgi:NADH:ubiquinone oxidoreductase subunit 2 (subunit N)